MTVSRICNKFAEDVLEEFLFGRLPAAKRAAIESHMARCVACRRRYEKVRREAQELRVALQVYESFRTIEKRRYDRIPARGIVQLRISRGTERYLTAQGRLLDKSCGGLGLIADRRCRAGSEIVVVRGTKQYRGVVRYCKPYKFGYHIGLEFLVA